MSCLIFIKRTIIRRFVAIGIFLFLLYNVFEIILIKNGVKLLNLQQIDMYLENKLKQNRNCVVFNFYELRVKLNLTSEETYSFLHLVSTKLENNNYNTYRTGQKYYYDYKEQIVKDNELLVAIKIRKEDVNNGIIQRRTSKKIK